jgi:hypothetical protein
VILGTCDLALAYRSPAAEEQVGLLVRCKVVVQETAEESDMVSITNSRAMFALEDNVEVTPVAEEADAGLRRFFDAIATASVSPRSTEV